MDENFSTPEHEPIPPVNITQRVQEKIREGYSYDFDKMFADAWRIFKQVFWMVAVGIIFLIIPVMLISFVLTPVLGLEQAKPDIRPGADFSEILQAMQEVQANVSVAARLKQSLLNFIYILLFAPLQAGFLGASRTADKEGASFGDIFQYYRHPATGRVVVAGIIVTLLNVLSAFAFGFMPLTGTILNLLLTIVFYYLFMFVYPLIIFGNASIGEAFSLSMKLFFKKPLPIIGYSLFFGLLSLSGIIGCCIAILFTVAFSPIGTYLLYKYSVGFPEDDSLDEQPHWQDVPPETL